MKSNAMKIKLHTARKWASSTAAKIGTGATGLMASGFALASGGSGSPGAAIAGELSGGKADQQLVIGACAILLGVVLVWAYVRRAAK